MFYEIRREKAVPGRGKDLARWMDEWVIPVHEACGMSVVGAFTDTDDDEAFVWIRRFQDEKQRETVIARVHQDPVFRAEIRPRLGDFLAGVAVTVRLVPTVRSKLV